MSSVTTSQLWILIVAMAVVAFCFKLLGFTLFASRKTPNSISKCLNLIPAALLSALVVKDTFSLGHHLVLDARAAGFAVAVLAAWRKSPLIVIVVLAAAATAFVRLLG